MIAGPLSHNEALSGSGHWLYTLSVVSVLSSSLIPYLAPFIMHFASNSLKAFAFVSPASGYHGFGHCSELIDEMIDLYLLGFFLCMLIS